VPRLLAPASDFNTQVIEEFRVHGAEVGGMFAGATLLLLHHTGARSGEQRTVPLVPMRDGERYVVFASKAGAPTNPAWYHNLIAHPQTTIEVGEQTVPVVATEATGEERERLFDAQKALSPQFAEYEQNTSRVIPVVLPTPAD
jgi:deazaflavin-dependent oxidoreductase (nitroreductase family)